MRPQPLALPRVLPKRPCGLAQLLLLLLLGSQLSQEAERVVERAPLTHRCRRTKQLCAKQPGWETLQEPGAASGSNR